MYNRVLSHAVGKSKKIIVPLNAVEEDVEKTLHAVRTSRKESEKLEELPELNDEFARAIGAFTDVADLKEKIKQGLTIEKERAEKDKRRGAIIEALLEKTEMKVPRIFVESELEKIFGQLKDDVARAGLTVEEYLKRIGKDEDELRNDFRAQAEKRAKLQLLLNKIAEEEKIEADEAAVEEEMKHALEHFKDAKPELLRIHIQTVLRNEKVLQKLEQQEEK